MKYSVIFGIDPEHRADESIGSGVALEETFTCATVQEAKLWMEFRAKVRGYHLVIYPPVSGMCIVQNASNMRVGWASLHIEDGEVFPSEYDIHIHVEDGLASLSITDTASGLTFWETGDDTAPEVLKRLMWLIRDHDPVLGEGQQR